MTWVDIREVFYGDNWEVEAWTAEGVELVGENEEELKADLELMLGAFDKPTLLAEDLPGVEDAKDYKGS